MGVWQPAGQMVEVVAEPEAAAHEQIEEDVETAAGPVVDAEVAAVVEIGEQAVLHLHIRY